MHVGAASHGAVGPAGIPCLWCGASCWEPIAPRGVGAIEFVSTSSRTPRFCCACGAWYCGRCKAGRLRRLRRDAAGSVDRRCVDGPCACEPPRFPPDEARTRPLLQRLRFWRGVARRLPEVSPGRQPEALDGLASVRAAAAAIVCGDAAVDPQASVQLAGAGATATLEPQAPAASQRGDMGATPESSELPDEGWADVDTGDFADEDCPLSGVRLRVLRPDHFVEASRPTPPVPHGPRVEEVRDEFRSRWQDEVESANAAARESRARWAQEPRRPRQTRGSGARGVRAPGPRALGSTEDALRLLRLPPPQGGRLPTMRELRAAYRAATLEAHPDRPQNRSRQAVATDDFQRVRAAFELLAPMAPP